MSEVRVFSSLKQREDAKDLPELPERSLPLIIEGFHHYLGLLILFRPLFLQVYHGGTSSLESKDERIAGLLQRLGEAESSQLLVYEQGIEGLQDMLRRFLPQDPGEVHIFPLAAGENLNGFVVLVGMGDDGGDKENRVLMSDPSGRS